MTESKNPGITTQRQITAHLWRQQYVGCHRRARTPGGYVRRGAGLYPRPSPPRVHDRLLARFDSLQFPKRVWGRDGAPLAPIYLSYLRDDHQRSCTLVTPLKCNNRVLNYVFGGGGGGASKHKVIDVFLPFHFEI